MPGCTGDARLHIDRVTALHYSCCSASGSHRDRGDVVHLLYVGHSAMACCWKTLVDQLHGVGGDDPGEAGGGLLWAPLATETHYALNFLSLQWWLLHSTDSP